ncbi:MAG: DsrE family protein [Acidiferrobacterales bacterium]|jgi:intracellular sulfur oxidation DsrE/DsrF family protein|nr:DsrE family protein [Acidiferrobacterales bacterium]
MKKLAALVVTAFLALGFSMAPAYAGSYGKQKVVYHINYKDLKRQKGALRNIQNHINAVGAKNLDLRVVMHGGGFTLLQAADKDLEMQNKIISLKEQGVKFQMCANTIRGKKLDKKKLFGLKDSDIVPSGVAEIAHLEAEGFSYIRP